jgi:ribosome-binding factor A
VFYTVLGTDEERVASGAALTSATGLLRKEVGRQLNVRLVPTLEFIPDALPENAGHIADLLRQARERDEEVAKLAVGATHAGDADPYVRDEDDEED